MSSFGKKLEPKILRGVCDLPAPSVDRPAATIWHLSLTGIDSGGLAAWLAAGRLAGWLASHAWPPGHMARSSNSDLAQLPNHPVMALVSALAMLGCAALRCHLLLAAPLRCCAAALLLRLSPYRDTPGMHTCLDMAAGCL